MRRSWITALALAAGLSAMSMAAVPASAHGSGVHHGFVGHSLYRPHAPFHHGFYRKHFYPYAYAHQKYAYDDGCYRFKARALRTGSRFWWHKYHECREG